MQLPLICDLANTSRHYALGGSNVYVVGENPTCSVPACRDARVYGHATTAMREYRVYPNPPPRLPLLASILSMLQNTAEQGIPPINTSNICSSILGNFADLYTLSRFQLPTTEIFGGLAESGVGTLD